MECVGMRVDFDIELCVFGNGYLVGFIWYIGYLEKIFWGRKLEWIIGVKMGDGWYGGWRFDYEG